MRYAKSARPGNLQRRSRYFVDPQLQGALLRQGVCYWLWTSATFALIIFVYRVSPPLLSGSLQPGQTWYHFAPYVVASAALLPIVIFNAIRFSNRFAGPMVRVRRTLKALAQGENPDRIVLRKDDFWGDLADDVNQINDQLAREPADESSGLAQ